VVAGGHDCDIPGRRNCKIEQSVAISEPVAREFDTQYAWRMLDDR
jgi:hypothetical protein